MALKLACNDLAAPGFCDTILFRQCLVIASVKLLADLLIPEIAAYFFLFGDIQLYSRKFLYQLFETFQPDGSDQCLAVFTQKGCIRFTKFI